MFIYPWQWVIKLKRSCIGRRLQDHSLCKKVYVYSCSKSLFVDKTFYHLITKVRFSLNFEISLNWIIGLNICANKLVLKYGIWHWLIRNKMNKRILENCSLLISATLPIVIKTLSCKVYTLEISKLENLPGRLRSP